MVGAEARLVWAVRVCRESIATDCDELPSAACHAVDRAFHVCIQVIFSMSSVTADRWLRSSRPGESVRTTILAVVIMVSVRVIGDSSEDEMVACFLLGEMTSSRFGAEIRRALAELGRSEHLLTDADLADPAGSHTRRALLAVTRGYGENRGVFEGFPTRVRWIRAVSTGDELARVRYIEYSYWNELSGGSRLPGDAAERIRAGVRVFGVSNGRFIAAARAVRRGQRFSPLILAGLRPETLVCLEGHLRLTAHALAGFPVEVECLVGTAQAMDSWAR
jgi:hypothetical protein